MSYHLDGAQCNVSLAVCVSMFERSRGLTVQNIITKFSTEIYIDDVTDKFYDQGHR